VIYTIGYQRLEVERLSRIVLTLELTLIDARSSPVSRKPGYGSGQLKKLFNEAYEHHPELGGRCAVSDSAVAEMARRNRRGESLLLLCMEHAPAECHRHTDLAMRLLNHDVDCLHICGDEIVRASELERSLVDGDDYECFEIPEDLR